MAIRLFGQPRKRERSPVDVFLRTDCLGDGALAVRANVGTQGKLDEDAVDGRVCVELLNELHDVVDGRLCRESDVLEGDADLLCGLLLHADVHAGVGASTGLDDDERCLKPRVGCLETPDALSDLVPHGPRLDDKDRADQVRSKEKEEKKGAKAGMKTHFARAVPSMSFGLDMCGRDEDAGEENEREKERAAAGPGMGRRRAYKRRIIFDLVRLAIGGRGFPVLSVRVRGFRVMHQALLACGDALLVGLCSSY